LPANYITATLARLLPPASELSSYTTEQLIELARMKAELEASIKIDPVKYFQPNPGAQVEFLTCPTNDSRVLLYVAGNKNGKSTAGGIRCIETLLGRPIWGRLDRTVKDNGPIRGAVFAEDFETHKEVTLPTLETWMPPGGIKRYHKNAAGQCVEIVLSNGSILAFRTYDQGSEKAEGKDWKVVWCDEPPPRDIYTAVMRGLVALDGYMFITATLLKEAWLYDEGREQDFVKVIEGTIHENQWLPEIAKRDFLATLDDEERMVRETGRPATLVGVVYKDFYDRPPSVIPIEEGPDPSKCVLLMGIDPHERRPCYVEYAWLDPFDTIYWFQWVLIPASPLEAFFERLHDLEDAIGQKPAIVYMDPNRGKARQLGGNCWEDVFSSEGYQVELGKDDTAIGITQLRSMISSGRMKWLESCRGKGGPIHQMLRFSWDERLHARRRLLSPLEKTKDANKDFPDIHRYVAMADPSYDLLAFGGNSLDLTPEREDRRGIMVY